MKKLPTKHDDEQQDVPVGYSREETRARRLIEEPGRLASKLHSASEKLDGLTSRSSKFATVRAELATLISLVRAWAAGDYREISTGSIVSIVAGIIYFLNPLDVVPDFIFGFGLLDDATVLAFVINRVSSELSQYRDWARQRNGATEGLAGEPDGDRDA